MMTIIVASIETNASFWKGHAKMILASCDQNGRVNFALSVSLCLQKLTAMLPGFFQVWFSVGGRTKNRSSPTVRTKATSRSFATLTLEGGIAPR